MWGRQSLKTFRQPKVRKSTLVKKSDSSYTTYKDAFITDRHNMCVSHQQNYTTNLANEVNQMDIRVTVRDKSGRRDVQGECSFCSA